MQTSSTPILDFISDADILSAGFKRGFNRLIKRSDVPDLAAGYILAHIAEAIEKEEFGIVSINSKKAREAVEKIKVLREF